MHGRRSVSGAAVLVAVILGSLCDVLFLISFHYRRGHFLSWQFPLLGLSH